MFRNSTLCFGIIILLPLLISACSQPYQSPKPKGWMRIDLPAKEYQLYDSLHNFFFQAPVYANILKDNHWPEQTDWVNIEFPSMNATLHISYKKVSNNLREYIDDAYTMAMKHLPKATMIRDSVIINPESRVYGLIYEIGGRGVASPLQFYLTDSTRHFVRASLYFGFRPNNDSIAPVIQFLRADVMQMIETFGWKKND
jgi:gliding motility-associated lipoprotein GldD